LLGLLNARVKRVKGPNLHVKRSSSHKLDKQNGIPQNALIKRRILREFEMSDRVEEGREDGVDRVLQILFVESKKAIVSGVETRDLKIRLRRSQSDEMGHWFDGTTQRKLHNR